MNLTMLPSRYSRTQMCTWHIRTWHNEVWVDHAHVGLDGREARQRHKEDKEDGEILHPALKAT